MSVRDVLRFCNDTVKSELRMFGGFGWIRLVLYEYGKIQLRYTIIYGSDTNKEKFVAVLDN